MAAPRARTIARTEVIHAHAEGKLNLFEQLGFEQLAREKHFFRFSQQILSYLIFSRSAHPAPPIAFAIPS